MAKQMSELAAWRPRTKEDRMLDAYWRSHGGTLFLEVPIGGPGGSDAWSDACTVRRIDGVLLSGVAAERIVHRFSRFTSELFRSSIRRPVELIEAKPRLNRSAIGQAIVARRMFARQYGAPVKRVTILVGDSDSALEWVCKEEDVYVEKFSDPSTRRITRRLSRL